MGGVLTQMETAGLIRRSPPPRRGTAISVELTDQGRAALDQTYPDVGDINDPAALGLNMAEARTLNELLHRVLAHLDSPSFVLLEHGV